MNKRVEETLIWRDKQFSVVSWQKILEEQRRLKREQEEADTASRRHTGIVPTHHQFITNERFGDLLNITDNTEKRKSGVEVQYRPVSYPSVSRKKDDRCFVSLWGCEGVMGLSAGFLQTQMAFSSGSKNSRGWVQWEKEKYELLSLSLNISSWLPDFHNARHWY